MKLYYIETVNSRIACAVARYLESPAEFVFVDLKKGEHKRPEYLALNPNGKVPVLDDGERKVWESTAIMCHLAARAKSDLWPEDPDQQVDIVRWLNWNAQHFLRHGGTMYFETVIKSMFGFGEKDPEKHAEAANLYKPFARVLDDHLSSRDYLVGNRLTVADFALAGLLPDAAEAGLPLDDCPAIGRWHDRLCALEAWRQPFPVHAEA